MDQNTKNKDNNTANFNNQNNNPNNRNQTNAKNSSEKFSSNVKEEGNKVVENYHYKLKENVDNFNENRNQSNRWSAGRLLRVR